LQFPLVKLLARNDTHLYEKIIHKKIIQIFPWKTVNIVLK